MRRSKTGFTFGGDFSVIQPVRLMVNTQRGVLHSGRWLILLLSCSQRNLIAFYNDQQTELDKAPPEYLESEDARLIRSFPGRFPPHIEVPPNMEVMQIVSASTLCLPLILIQRY